jgi:hypothetical protein
MFLAVLDPPCPDFQFYGTKVSSSLVDLLMLPLLTQAFGRPPMEYDGEDFPPFDSPLLPKHEKARPNSYMCQRGLEPHNIDSSL